MKSPDPATPNTVELAARAEASAWITRLHGPNRSPEMDAGLRRWLAERPENAQEFEALTEIWDLVAGGLPAAGAPRLERWEHSQESQELQALRASQGQRSRAAPRVWARAALVLLTCGLFAAGAYRFWFTPAYSTGIGEQRIVQLSDSTRVSLNSNSRLVVFYRDRERRVKLEKGEAFFEVAPDPSRPFSVIAGNHRVTALGTSFVVRYEADRTAVTLVEGKVSVADEAVERAENSRQGEVLTPGQRLTLAERAAPKLDTPRIEAVTAWRRGEVMLDDTPLADAVAEMNRYDNMSIVLDGPALGELIVSGLFHTGDSEGFARSVAKMYGLRMVEDAGRIRLQK